MSGDEVVVLLASGFGAFILWGMWLHTHAGVGHAKFPRGSATVALVVPLVSAVILFVVLKTRSSFDVQDSPLYLTFYMLLGAAWIGLAMRFTATAGISARDDTVERRNGAAAIALAGAMIGFTFAFAGGNIGDGPGWWVVVFAAGLATIALYLLWIVLDAATHVGDAITIDRDEASGIRLAGFLVAQGIVLGRSVAGDWISAGATVRDMAVAAWPSLILLGFAIMVERSFRPTPERPRPGVPAYGVFPAIAYVIAAIAVVLRLDAQR
jgi:uncharacterized membrane protein YjfL (UPF0719 family)